MASTYSITFSITNNNVGYPAVNPLIPTNNYQIEDAYAGVTQQQRAMMLGAQVQCKPPGGTGRYFTIDPYRSDPTKNLIFLLPV